MSDTVERKKATTKPLQYERCNDCGSRFVVRRKWQKFCTKTCKFRAWAKLNPRIRRGAL